MSIKRLIKNFNSISLAQIVEIISISTLFVFTIVIYYYNRNYAKWDFPGHAFQSISSLTNLEGSVYSFKYLLGFHPVLYPPLIPFLRDVSSTVFGVSPSVFVIGVSYLIQLVVVILLYKISKLQKVSFLFLLLVLYVLLTTSIGFATVSLLHAGTFPAYAGYALISFLTYVFLRFGFTESNYLVYGLILGIAFLLHSITASALIIFYLVILIYNILNWDKHVLALLLKSFFIGSCIGAIWLVPYLTMNAGLPRSGINGYLGITHYFLALMFIGYGAKKFINDEYNDKEKIAYITASLFVLISICPFQFFGLGLHLYRYMYIGLIIGFGVVFSNTRPTKNLGVYSLFIIILLGVLLFREYSTFSSRVNNTTIAYENVQLDMEGRVLDTVSKRDLDVYTHYFYTYLVESNKNLVGNDGLFVENAPNGFLAASMRVGFNRSAWFPLFSGEYVIPLSESVRNNIDEKIELFGISNIIFASKEDEDLNRFIEDMESKNISDEIQDTSSVELENENLPTIETDLVNDSLQNEGQESDPSVIDVGVIESNLMGVKTNIHVKHLPKASPLVVVLDYIPEYIPDEEFDFASIWNDLNLYNLKTNDPLLMDNELDVDVSGQYEASSIEIDESGLSFIVNSDNKVPILVKFAYSPYLVAYANGEYIDIIKVTPDFILLVANGEIELKPFLPISFIVAKVLTVVSLLLTLLYILIPMLKRVDKKVKI